MAKKSLQKTAKREMAALADTISLRLDEARDQARDWQDLATTAIRKSPGVCLGAAFILGFALSRVARHA